MKLGGLRHQKVYISVLHFLCRGVFTCLGQRFWLGEVSSSMGEERQRLVGSEVPEGRSWVLLSLHHHFHLQETAITYLPYLIQYLQQPCKAGVIILILPIIKRSLQGKVTFLKWHLTNGKFGIQTQIFIYVLPSQIPYVSIK